MKKLLVAFLITVFVVPFTFLFVSCKKPSARKLSTHEFYAMAAASSAQYLMENSNASKTKTSMLALDSATTLPAGHSKQIAKYLDMFKGMLDDSDSNFYRVSQNEETAEDLKGYSYKMSFVFGTDNNCTLYYTETNSSTHEEIDDGEMETETNTSLEGILETSNGNKYAVEGLKKNKTEGSESESKIYLMVSLNTVPTIASQTGPSVDNNNFILIENSTENEIGESEISYEYTVTKNGARVEKTEVEFENERNKKSLEIEFKEYTGFNKNDNDKTVYKIVPNKNGTYRVSQRATNDRNYGKNFFTIETSTSSDNTVTYTFKDNDTVIATETIAHAAPTTGGGTETPTEPSGTDTPTNPTSGTETKNIVA